MYSAAVTSDHYNPKLNDHMKIKEDTITIQGKEYTLTSFKYGHLEIS